MFGVVVLCDDLGVVVSGRVWVGVRLGGRGEFWHPWPAPGSASGYETGQPTFTLLRTNDREAAAKLAVPRCGRYRRTLRDGLGLGALSVEHCRPVLLGVKHDDWAQRDLNVVVDYVHRCDLISHDEIALDAATGFLKCELQCANADRRGPLLIRCLDVDKQTTISRELS
jgi:hypothetical protein